MLTILASLAQQESENISRNVKLGLKFRYQKGFVMVNHKKFLGYDRDVDWLRNRNTLEYIGIWEKVYNPNFNYGEFATIRNQS